MARTEVDRMGVFAFAVLLLLPFKISCSDSVTTTPVPISTPAPPSVPKYSIRNGSSICLMLQTDLRVNIKYYNTKGDELYKDFYLNKTEGPVATTGKCLQQYQYITLSWPQSNDSNVTFSTTLNFSLTGNVEFFSLNSITFKYSLTDQDFPDTNDTETSYSVGQEVSKFTCPVGSFYRCLASQTFQLEDEEAKSGVVPKPLVLYELSSMKVEAFRNSAKEEFVGKELMCTADYVPNRIIPIVVGIILAILILITIVAFIIGSRRRRTGYQTL